MEVGDAVDEVVDRVPELVGDGVDRVRELLGRDDEPAAAEVGAVEPEREVEQRVVALVADALDDLADGRRDVRVDLEVTGLEPLPPLTEVEELERSVLLGGLVMLRDRRRRVTHAGRGRTGSSRSRRRTRRRRSAARGRAGTWIGGP